MLTISFKIVTFLFNYYVQCLILYRTQPRGDQIKMKEKISVLVIVASTLLLNACLTKPSETRQLIVDGWEYRDKSINFKFYQPEDEFEEHLLLSGCTSGDYTNEIASTLRQQKVVVSAKVRFTPTGLNNYCKIIDETMLIAKQ